MYLYCIQFLKKNGAVEVLLMFTQNCELLCRNFKTKIQNFEIGNSKFQVSKSKFRDSQVKI